MFVLSIESQFEVFYNFYGFAFVNEKTFHRTQNMRESIIFQEHQAISYVEADFDDFQICKILLLLNFSLNFVFKCIPAELEHQTNIPQVGTNRLVSGMPEPFQIDKIFVGERLS